MKKIKKKDKKKYLQLTIIMIVVFLILIIAVIVNVRAHYINLRNNEAVNLSKSYSKSFERAARANEIAEELLDERIQVSLSVLKEHNHDEILGFDEFQYDNEGLAIMARTLELDEIYLYNTDLEIIASATNSYIGWKSYPNHPVSLFAVSEHDVYVEEIRKDSESEFYYKYGYIRLKNSQIIQVGLSADRIYEFLNDINIETILNQTINQDSVHSAYFVTTDNKIITANNNAMINPLSQELFDSTIESDYITQQINDNGTSLIEVLVPIITTNNELQGIIGIRYPLTVTTQLITSTLLTIAIPLIIVFFMLYRLILSRLKSNDQLLELAYIDPVSNLYNRTYLKEQIFNVLVHENLKNQHFILINCTNFKYINQTYGFNIGDHVLHQIGLRMHNYVDSPNIFRFTADRFVVITKNDDNSQSVTKTINSINRVFSEAFSVKSADVFINASMSIVEISDEYSSFDELMKEASFALDQQRDSALQNYIYFNEDMRNQIKRNETILSELRQTIFNEDHENLTCYFQPIISMEDNHIVGFEALSRLHSSSLSNITPDEFIPIAENNQLIIPLGNHVLENACKFLSLLSKAGFKDTKVTINVSAIELFQKDYVDRILKRLKYYNLESSRLTIEITESILFSDFDYINRKLRQLQAYGIRVALDDFGTGYSSFDRMDSLNINVLKIDRYFVDKITKRRKNEVIISDIISMAHKFGLSVVAEGVENNEQFKYLQQHNCDMMQGYYFSKALKSKDALILIRNWSKSQTINSTHS